MKRTGHLWEKVATLDNVLGAMVDYNARRRAGRRRDVDLDLAQEIVSRMETDFRGLVGTPRRETIPECGKMRDLQVPSYVSCVAQIALWRVCGPYVERRIHTQSFSSRKGMGGHLMAKKCERFVHLNIKKDAKYHLYFDIRKFYQHIDHGVAMSRLERIFKDKKVLSAFRAVIDSSDEGLPIGYPFSHAIANLYLVPLYERLVQIKGVSKMYVYMDNCTIFSRYKKPLHKARALAQEWLKSVGCEMKGDWQVAPTASRPVKVCGFRIGAGQTLLYRGNWHRTMRDFAAACRGVSEKMLSMASRRGWLRFINREFSEVFRTEDGTFMWHRGNKRRRKKTADVPHSGDDESNGIAAKGYSAKGSAATAPSIEESDFEDINL